MSTLVDYMASFNPVVARFQKLAPSLLTQDVVLMARAILQATREWNGDLVSDALEHPRMGFADALREAGCDDDEVFHGMSQFSITYAVIIDELVA